MSSCPSAEQLLCLLDEQLDPADEDRIVAHVETCSRCQGELDELVRNRLPNPAWPASAPAEIAARSGPAPESSPLEASPEASGDSAAQPDVTFDQAPIAERPMSRDPAPTEPDGPAGSQEPTDVDRTKPHDRAATCDVATEPIALSPVTTDFIPPRSNGPIHAGAIDAAGDEATDVDPNCTGDETAVQSDLAAPAPRPSPDRSGASGPEIPGYEILGKLGAGGMGVVYKARQRGLNRLVALKMIIGGTQARVDHLARFRIEAEAVARLRHPNILQIYDIGEVDGLPFVSLELLEGGDLYDRLEGTPQPGRSGSELVATLARAVHAAHQAGIIHRDLKPTNVLFTEEGVPKITDFGLAKRLESDSNQTETGQIMGTPSYMAPEQARGHTKDIGPAADTYALGAILYHVLTGRPPFMGETPLETVRQVTDDEPVPPSRLVPRVPRDLETICLKCLQKEAKKRYASAQDLADDLDRYRSGNPILARPTSVWERGWKWSKRRPGQAAAVAGGILLFIGLIAGAIGYLILKNDYVVQEQNRGLRLITRAEAAIVQLQNQGLKLITQAEAARDRERLDKAEFELSQFLKDVQAERKLEPIALQVGERRKRVLEELQLLDERAAQAARDQAAKDRDLEDSRQFQTFLELREDAQLYAAVTGALLSSDHLEKFRASAHEALQIYAQNPEAADEAWGLVEPLPTALKEPEKRRVREGCYHLLLILSQAADPARGLRILERAARLHPEPTAAYHLRRAECFERAGDLAGRDRETRAAQLRAPATPLDYFLSGRELVSRGRYDEAIDLLRTAVQQDLNQTSANLLLAACYTNVRPRQLGAAMTNLDDCIKSHPKLVGLYLLRALISTEQGSEARSKDAANTAFERAETAYATALGLKPNDAVLYALLCNRGFLRLQSGRLDEAATDLNAAVRLKANPYEAHTNLAQVLQRQGRLELAEAAFSRGIACHPEPSVLAGLYRSRALVRANRTDITPAQRAAALYDFEQAIGQEPDQVKKASDQVWRARLFLRANQCPEALAACDAALSLAPDDPEAHRVRVAALMELKRFDAVLASADAYLARGKPIAEILEIRGLAHQARANYTAAIADFSRALDLTPAAEQTQQSRLLNRRGWAYQYADAPKLALADFEESLRLEPNQSAAYGGRGLARIRLGDWRPAISDAEAGIRQARGATAGSGSDDAEKVQVQALFNGARIYAQAVEFAAREVSREGERAVTLYRRYRTRASDLLDGALQREPDQTRRAEILNDPALQPLRRRTGPSPAARGNRASLAPVGRGWPLDG
jgi:tetratricopeptide (TPR) repeat protein/tRNA A-37 threonylcarbamoyl transferase component Bud32